MQSKKISVIIATQDRLTLLTQCINGLAHQTYQDFELIIINSGINKISKNLPLFKGLLQKILKESLIIVNVSKKLVPPKAWNQGIKLSSGKIIAFIDDDAIANNNWLKAILTSFTLRPTIAAINGKIESVSSKTMSERIRQTYYDFRDFMYSHGLFDLINKKQYRLQTTETNLADWLSMSNSAIQKKYLKRVQIFDERMSLNAGHKLGHEFMSNKLLVSYNSLAVVKHNHYRKIMHVLKIKIQNGIYLYNIDSEFRISSRKRFFETSKYIKYILQNKKLRWEDKIVESLFIFVQYGSYFYQKLITFFKLKRRFIP